MKRIPFPWREIGAWLGRHQMTREQVGLQGVHFRGKLSPSEGRALLDRMWTLILEDSPEGEDLMVIDQKYRSGRWNYLSNQLREKK